MKLFTYSWTVRRGNLASSFYKFCRNRDWKLVFYHWKFLWFQLLSIFSIVSKEKAIKEKWFFLQKVNQLDSLTNEFVKKEKQKLYAWFVESKEDMILVEDVPKWLLDKITADLPQVKQIYGLSFSDSHQLEAVETKQSLINQALKEQSITKVITGMADIKCEKEKINVLMGKPCFTKEMQRTQQLKKLLWNLLLLAGLALVITIFTFIFATIHIRYDLLAAILQDPVLVFMNWFPIFLLMVFCYGISGRSASAFFITAFIIFVVAMINYFKLLFRDEPFQISDIILIQEAKNMAGKYSIRFNYKQWLTLLFMVWGAWILSIKTSKIKLSKVLRLSCILVVCILGIVSWKTFYLKSTIYDTHVNKKVMNQWSGTQMFQARGFVYPFIYSYTYAVEREPEYYDPKKAEETLQAYNYASIPEKEKVNIIGIMLESYNDFSKFDIDFLIDPYKNFHDLQKESIYGNIITNIFAGGTVSTERSFLNGYQHHPSYKKTTNSFVHYFNEQGYYTEALHPSYGWFYNRRNINNYLGFSNFYYIENYFERIVDDHTLFPEIIKGYEENKKRNQPYFNFTVTYQNHGPYSEGNAADAQYLVRKDGVGDAQYHLLNNYLNGVYKTDQALKELFDYFRNESEPVIIVLFGDHNPLLGDGNSGYLQQGIDLDMGTVQGFKNYYETPYLFWGNDAAKSVLDNELLGQGETFGPSYLMPKLFETIGWEGNEYMQYLSDVYQVMPVMNAAYYNINGEWVKELNEEQKKFYEDFVNAEYYYSHNYWKEDREK